MTRYAVSVDVGGTFTDVYAHDTETGEILIRKVPSSPDNPARAIVAGVRALGVPGAEIASITHGTTVGTNALVTRSFPDAALITTRGFRDVLEIGKSTKPHLWDAYVDVSPPYIARRHRFEVTERILFDGSVSVEPVETEVRRIARILGRRGITSVGVCLINSYANGTHERRVRDLLLDEQPGLLVSLSSDVLPEMFEFERTSTTATNAVLGPVVGQYMDELASGLRELSYTGEVLVLHSGGGVMTAGTVTRYAARIAASGPAAGAVAMAHVAKQCGTGAAIGFDVGGTTSDVSVCTGGEIRVTKDWGVEYGHPIAFPSVELVTIGAGGGSIAWIDDGGALRSGPRSAGAVPGPAAYLRGGIEPTTTDANLVLGRLGTELIGGGLVLDVEEARAAIAERIAVPLGYSVEEAAAAIVRVTVANMTEAIRLVSIERGLDPREFALVAFGGGGPLHAVDVAREAAIPTVIVPAHPGVTSAYGCSLVDIEHDVTRSWFAALSAEIVPTLAAEFAKLDKEGAARLADERLTGQATVLTRTVEMRYAGQWRTIAVPHEAADDDTVLRERFESEHEKAFGYRRDGDSVEVCGLRVHAVALIDRPEIAPAPAPPIPMAAGRGTRPAWDQPSGSWVEVPLVDRADLLPGMTFTGPVIIGQLDSTTWVPAGVEGLVDGHRNIVLEIGRQS